MNISMVDTFYDNRLVSAYAPSSVTATVDILKAEITVSVIEGTETADQFKIQIQELTSSPVWNNIGTELVETASASATFIVNSQIASGNRYRAIVMSSIAGSDSEAVYSETINIGMHVIS